MNKKRKDSTRWIQDLDKGGLHETTHTPMGQEVSQSKIEAAKHGAYGAKGKKQANAAEDLKGLRKKKGK